MRFPPGVRSRRLLPWLALAAAILLAVAAAWWWQGHRQTGSGGTGASAPADPGRSGGRGGPNRNGAGTTAQPVSVGVVDRRDVRVLISAIGTLNARATAVVRAKVSGELQKLHFKEGDEVTAVVVNVDRKTRNIQLSIKAKDQVDQQEAMASLSAQSAKENAGTTSLGALLRAKLDNSEK